VEPELVDALSPETVSPRLCPGSLRSRQQAETIVGLVPQRYVAPNWFRRNVFNRLVAALARVGISVWGSRILEVRGRKTGEPRRTPVNLLTLDGSRYLVAPRGHTQWVRNLRVAGEGELLLGRRRERFVCVEVPDDEREPILRAYLSRWKWKVGQFFGGIGADSPTGDIRRIAPDHPIFRIESPPMT
jgi:deazaflavin-dependent oxidoreductase (nitroreductase family)